jgi:hypothetical protein
MNELVAEKGNEEPVAVRKSNGKTPNKKDREEHHFWVVKECGHVSLSHSCTQDPPDITGLLQ